MGLTLFTLAGALRSVRRWLGRPARRAADRAPGARRLHTAPGRAHVCWPPSEPLRARRPLRVLRVVDAGHAPSTAGRMVISGRMADVCAELERLVALEAAAA